MKTISRTIYKDWYNSEYQSSSVNSIFGKPRDEVMEFIKYLRQGQSIIELGCGDGRNIRELLKKKLMVTGVDLINKEILDNKALNNNFEYIQDDILNINLFKNRYSSLLCSEVLHMFTEKEIRVVLKKCMNTVQYNGYIFVDILSDLSRKFTETGETFNWDKEAHYSIEDSENLFFNIFSDWDIIKIGHSYDKQYWPIGNVENMPIKPYIWEGTYVYIIAKKGKKWE